MNGFFGKIKAAFTRSAPVSRKQEANIKPRRLSNPNPRGRATTTGAFGGVGTGRGQRGRPGRKLVKKTVKAGWSAQNRVVLSTKPVGIIGGHS